MAVTVGANLTVVQEPLARKLSLAVMEFVNRLRIINGHTVTMYGKRGDIRVFTKAGAPADSTADDSPGQDLCFVIDTTNNDLYLIYGWASSTSFTKVKILEATAV